MNRIYTFLLLGVFVSLFASCAKEDALTPSNLNEDYFTVPEDATDTVSVMRRNFYKETGIHLLFNDTLRHEQRGTYADGTPYWYTERVDLTWKINTSTEIYYYDFLAEENYQKGIDFVKTYLLPHMGKQLCPYSFLLVNQVMHDDYGYMEDDPIVDGTRCWAVSLQDVFDVWDDPDELEALAQDLLYGILYDRVRGSTYNKEFSEFDAFGEKYAGEYYEDVRHDLPEGMDYRNITREDVYSLGFLWYSTYMFRYYTNDRADYLKQVMYTDEEEFKATYADYPIILQKYDVTKEILLETIGYKF